MLITGYGKSPSNKKKAKAEAVYSANDFYTIPPFRAAFFIPVTAGFITLLWDEYTSHRVFTGSGDKSTFIQT